MATAPCVILYGDSVFLAGIRADLVARASLQVLTVEPGCPDVAAIIRERRPAALAALVQKVDPLFTLSKNKLKELKDKGDEKLKKEKGDSAPLLADLRLWYEVRLHQDADPDAALALFQAQPFVAIAAPAPQPVEPPDAPSAPTPTLTGLQGYLGAAPGGVDAEYAWTLLVGRGAGITIYDVEYGWWQNHEDLSQAHGLSLLLNAGDVAARSRPTAGAYSTDPGQCGRRQRLVPQRGEPRARGARRLGGD